MTFKAYLDNIEARTGVTPKQFIELGKAKGYGPATKATEVVNWLKADYGLGHGHAMAIVKLLKDSGVLKG